MTTPPPTPKWPRGRAIAETSAFFAKGALIVQVGAFAIAQIFPNLDPGDPSLTQLAIGLGLALLLGSVWFALRHDRLGLAQIAVALNGVLLAGIILSVILRNIRNDDTIGVFEGLILYGVGTVFLVLYGLAFREIAAERLRRKDRDA